MNIITLTLDTAKKTITLLISATNTAAIAWRKGVYELVLEKGLMSQTRLDRILRPEELTRPQKIVA